MNIFTCKQCGREFQGKIHETICPICTDTNLFLIAKDVIRENHIFVQYVAKNYLLAQFVLDVYIDKKLKSYITAIN